MSYTIEIDNALESLEILKALQERREKEVKMHDDTAVESIDNLINQLEGTTAYQVVIEGD